MSAPYYLDERTLLEPLVNRWPAWWLTVAPLPASLHLARYQLPLLNSYLQNPEFHERTAKSKDPALAGTGFVQIPAARAPEVRELLQRTKTSQAAQLKLAEDFEALQARLAQEYKGQSLEPLYAALSPSLRGLVELVYDYQSRPTARVLEPLTYRSAHFRKDLHAIRLSRVEADLERPFFLATPRLAGPGGVDLAVELSSERLDAISRLDSQPRPLEEIRELLGGPPEAELLPLLTQTPPPPPKPWPAEEAGCRVRYLGHACALIEYRGTTLMVDPFVAPRTAAPGATRVSFSELPPRIDFALITHAHADHYALEVLLRLRHRIGTLVVPRNSGLLVGDCSLRLMSQNLGFPRVVEVDALDKLPFDGGEVVAVPFLGEHGDLAHAKTAYAIRVGQRSLLFAADSACLEPELYATLRGQLGEFEAVFMNTESQGSPLTFTIEALFPKVRDRKLEKNRRARGSTCEEGLRLLDALKPKRLYNYAMGLEPWLAFIVGPPSPLESERLAESDKLLAGARERGLSEAIRLSGPAELHFPA